MNYERITLDSKSVRSIDKNGYLHVAISPLTKEQVAPYHGFEIPHYEDLGFKANETYYGYRPESELKKPETIESTNGIPIQFRHHIDSAENPAKQTRVGSTGTDGAYSAPYLTNSLHIQDETAKNRINDGSLRELSLAYWYDPVKKSGEFNGQHYDFLMTNIRANHLALVEEGRAGSDVLVYDSKFIPNEEKNMDENKTLDPKKLAELLAPAIAQAVSKAMGCETPVTDEDEEKDEPTLFDKDEEKREVREDKPEHDEDEIEDAESEEVVEDEDEDEIEAESEETEEVEDEPEDEEDEDEGEDLGIDAEILKACGMDGEPPEIQRAFAAGVRYGEKKEKDEPKHLDSLHESEGMKREEAEKKMAHDAAYQAINERLSAKFEALENVRSTLGSVKFAAFDSAEDVYAAAYRKETGKRIDPQFARVAYESYISGRGARVAQDSKKSSIDGEMESKTLSKYLE